MLTSSQYTSRYEECCMIQFETYKLSPSQFDQHIPEYVKIENNCAYIEYDELEAKDVYVLIREFSLPSCDNSRRECSIENSGAIRWANWQPAKRTYPAAIMWRIIYLVNVFHSIICSLCDDDNCPFVLYTATTLSWANKMLVTSAGRCAIWRIHW